VFLDVVTYDLEKSQINYFNPKAGKAPQGGLIFKNPVPAQQSYLPLWKR